MIHPTLFQMKNYFCQTLVLTIVLMSSNDAIIPLFATRSVAPSDIDTALSNKSKIKACMEKIDN